MKYIRQLGIILAVSFAGELFRRIIPLPIPASIYGMVFMLILLKTKLIRYESVKDAGEFLIEIMPLMFIPAGVGLLVSWESIRGILLPIAVIILAANITVFAATGKTADWLLGGMRWRDEGIS